MFVGVECCGPVNLLVLTLAIPRFKERLESVVSRIGRGGNLPVLYVVPQVRDCFFELFGPTTPLAGHMGCSVSRVIIDGVECLLVLAPHPSPRQWQGTGGYMAWVDGLRTLRGVSLHPHSPSSL